MYHDCYDIIYKNYDYLLDVDCFLKVINENFPDFTFDNVLEIGCGTAMHTALLSRYFSSVWAIDQDAEMIRRAHDRLVQMNIQNIQLLNASAAQLPQVQLPLFSCACAFFNVINYVLDIDSLKEFFHGISNAISPFGVYFFDCLDVNNPYKLNTSFQDSYTQGGNSFLRETISSYSSDAQTLHVTEQFKDRVSSKSFVYEHTYKLWDPVTIENIARSYGLQTLMSQKKTDFHSDYKKKNQIIFVMNKREN